MASAMAPDAGPWLCGDAERSDQALCGTADAMLEVEDDGYACGDAVLSGPTSCEEIDWVRRACSWFLGLLRFEEDAELTAADAGVTVIATVVCTTGDDVSDVSVVVGVVEEGEALGIPF